VRVITVAPTAPPRSRARDLDVARGPIVAVIDVDEAWGAAKVDGHQVAVLSPGDELTEQIPALAPGRVIVNLAAAGALAAIARLRAGGSDMRFWGCVADPRSGRALPLGMVEPASAPLDPDAIVGALARYAVRGTRVVTAGADVDGLMSLRQALARRGMSVSMAWDGKQASELLVVVRPEVVVVDLGLPRRDGYGILARLGTVDPVPAAVVIPAADDFTTAFAAALADPVHASRIVGLDDVLTAIVTRSEAPPAEKRSTKVRVMGRK